MTRCPQSRGSLLTRRAVAVPVALAALAPPGRAAAPPLLRLQGSTTFDSELMAEHKGAIEAASGVRLDVVPNKSSLGLIALCEDEADLAMISTRLANEVEVLGAGRHVAAPDQVRVQNGPQIVRVVEQEPGALGITQLKLTTGQGVRELGTPAALEQVLLLVSLGDLTPPMLAVINGCRTAASAAGLR